MAVEAGQTGAIAANANSGNVLAGKTYEYVPRKWRRGANIRIAAIAGLAASTSTTATVKIDTESVADAANIPYAARFPLIPDDQFLVHWAPPGARIYMNFNGGSVGAAAPGVNWKMDMEPA